MGSGRSSGWSKDVVEALEQLRASDAVEQLRHQIEDLLVRVGSDDAGEADRPIPPAVDDDMQDLGTSMDQASDLLSELTDVLEAQTERIETIERQLGDPVALGEGEEAKPEISHRERLERLEDVLSSLLNDRYATQAAADSAPATQKNVEAIAGTDATPVGDVLAVMMDRMDDAFSMLAQRLDRIQAAMGELGSVAGQRDKRIQELEERLLILVDTEADRRVRGEDQPPPEPRHLETPSPRSTESSVADTSGGSRQSASEVLRAEFEQVIDREVSLLPGRVAAASEGRSHLPRKASPTVMVVDSAADARTLLSMYLSKTGFQVVTAASAEDCLAKLRHHDVDAIVLDAGLPGADGGHVCSVLRSDPTFADKRHTPVIVYAGYPEDDSRRLAQEWAADDYVAKGGDMLPLISSLLRVTGTSETASGP